MNSISNLQVYRSEDIKDSNVNGGRNAIIPFTHPKSLITSCVVCGHAVLWLVCAIHPWVLSREWQGRVCCVYSKDHIRPTQRPAPLHFLATSRGTRVTLSIYGCDDVYTAAHRFYHGNLGRSSHTIYSRSILQIIGILESINIILAYINEINAQKAVREGKRG